MSKEKYEAELKFWAQEIDQYVTWYNGSIPELYGIPRPGERVKIKRHADVRANALETWTFADRWRYCWHLFIEPTYFMGKSVLEIGCGPLGLSQWFVGADIHGVDPLKPYYKAAGYHIDDHTMKYHMLYAESLWSFPDNAFDAVISVNAIDHVDDFEAAISEIERVTKPDGEIRLETHFHEATETEPVVLDSERVRSAFKKFDMSNLSYAPSSYFYPRGTHPETDRFALWSNKEHMYPAREVLK